MFSVIFFLSIHDDVSDHYNAVKHLTLANNTLFEESEIIGYVVMRFLQNTFTPCYYRLLAAAAPIG
jgi:hypothetical protein